MSTIKALIFGIVLGAMCVSPIHMYAMEPEEEQKVREDVMQQLMAQQEAIVQQEIARRLKIKKNEAATQLLVDVGFLSEEESGIAPTDGIVDRGPEALLRVNCYGMTPLVAAMFIERTDIAQALIDTRRIDINAKDDTGVTALAYATCTDIHWPLVPALIGAKADVNAEVHEDRISALIGASQAGHVGIVRQLLNAKAVVDYREVHGATALMFAAEYGKDDVIRLLLEAGADINACRIDDGGNVLLAAVRSQHLSTTQLLIEKKADLWHKHNIGFTAVEAAVIKNNRPILIALLTAMKAEGKEVQLKELFKNSMIFKKG